MTLLAGVDAGASHTEAVIVEETQQELSRHRGDPGNVSPGGISKAATAIEATVRGALEHAGRREGITTLVVGAAGTGLESDRTALQNALAATGIAASVHVTTDAAIAIESVFPEGPGIILMAGTGSIAHATDGAGGQWRVGGLGWRLGDEGSAFALGTAGIAAAIRGLDSRGPATALGHAMPDAIDVNDIDGIRDWMADAAVPRVAALARAVCTQAEAGDEVAVLLVREAGRALAAHVTALLQHFPHAARVPVALGGGLLTPDSAVRNAVLTMLALQAPQAELLDIEVDPPRGAIRMAVQIAAGT